MAAQPSQPPGWPPPRLLRGEGEEQYPGAPPPGPPPGGPPSGGAPGEHEAEAAEQAAKRRLTEKITAGVLIGLGTWVALALFHWGGPPPQGVEQEPTSLDLAHILALLASLFSVASGFNLLINGSSPPADTKKRQAGENVAILMMVLGGLLGITMLGHPPTALLIPAVITAFLLFTYGLVTLQQKKKNN